LCNIPELTLNRGKLNVSICSHQRSPQSLLATQKILKRVCKETNQKLELRTVDTLGDLIPLYPTAWVVQKYAHLCYIKVIIAVSLWDIWKTVSLLINCSTSEHCQHSLALLDSQILQYWRCRRPGNEILKQGFMVSEM